MLIRSQDRKSLKNMETEIAELKKLNEEIRQNSISHEAFKLFVDDLKSEIFKTEEVLKQITEILKIRLKENKESELKELEHQEHIIKLLNEGVLTVESAEWYRNKGYAIIVKENENAD